MVLRKYKNCVSYIRIVIHLLSSLFIYHIVENIGELMANRQKFLPQIYRMSIALFYL